MRKRLLFLALVMAGFMSASFGQTYPGYRTGNYTGVNGVFFNPANIADNRFKWNINLIAVNGFVGTDQGGLKFSDITKSFNGDDLKKNLLRGKTNINSLDYADILGPSVMFSLSPKTSLAFTTRSRVFANARNVNGDLANAIIDPSNSGITAPVAINNTGQSLVHATGWTDLGFSVGQVFTNKNSHSFVKGGITLKYIAGTADSYLQTNNLNGTINAVGGSAALVGPFTGNLSINTTDANFSDYKLGDAFKFNGHGFGGDIGFVYEYRPNLDYSQYTNDRWANKYKLKIGVSLLDVGRIKFNKSSNTSAAYNIAIPAGQNYDLGVFNGKSINQFIPILNASPLLFPKQASPSASYNVNLPTTIQANIDYMIGGNFAVDLAGQFNVNTKTGYNLYYYNSYSLTPRWENSLISVELPLNYNELTQFNAGLAFRIGPFFIGSGSVISAIFHDTKQADLHVGFNWGMQWKKKIKPDTDKDGVYDDVDKCPTVFGLARYQGCPIPDTDGDGINDEMDSCVTVPGVARYNGCPVPDTDKDGVNDEEDSCKTVPGLPQFHGCPDTDGDGIPDPSDKCPTVFGVAKYQGCPIPDTDGDGINDEEDLCPTKPGPASTRGCPVEDVVVKIKAEFKNLLFTFGKATLRPESDSIIQHAVKVMNEQIPNSNFYIDGYTDNVGSAVRNKSLSKQRAQAVVNALVKDGVAKDRLIARGFGKDNPICPNNTADGRQCNRRVEVIIRNIDQSKEKKSINVK